MHFHQPAPGHAPTGRRRRVLHAWRDRHGPVAGDSTQQGASPARSVRDKQNLVIFPILRRKVVKSLDAPSPTPTDWIAKAIRWLAREIVLGFAECAVAMHPDLNWYHSDPPKREDARKLGLRSAQVMPLDGGQRLVGLQSVDAGGK
jgi:hypothetical protein